MFTEQLAVMIFIAAAQMAPYQSKPAAEDARHALIRAVKEPELVSALSMRAKRAKAMKHSVVVEETLMASAN